MAKHTTRAVVPKTTTPETTYGGTVLCGPSGLDQPSALIELWGIGTARPCGFTGCLRNSGYPISRIASAIIQYLSEAFEVPASFFAPTDPAERAKIHEWCYFTMNELDGHTRYVIRRHVGLKHIYGEAHTAVNAAKTYFREQIEALEPRFNAISHYLFGKDLSIADILLTTCLDWAVSVDIVLPATVLSYRGRTSRRPAYREARRRNDPSIPPSPESLTTPSAET